MHELVQEICNVISTVGFPIGVTCYLLFRDSTLVKDLTASVEKNTDVINRLIDHINIINGN